MNDTAPRRLLPPARRSGRGVVDGSTLAERDLVGAAQHGVPGAREQLVDAYMPRIASVSRMYRTSSTTIERRELLHEGVAGLLTALRHFDPARGTPFWAYASWWVRHAMQQLVAERARPVVLSDRALRQLARVKDARTAHARVHRAWPTARQLAAATGLSSAQVALLIAVDRVPKALSEPDDAEGADGATARAECLADERAEDEYERTLTRVACDGLARLLDDLSERERGVLRARYGFDGPQQTLRQIGRRLDLSAERVRQVEQQALEELRTVVTA